MGKDKKGTVQLQIQCHSTVVVSIQQFLIQGQSNIISFEIILVHIFTLI